MRASIVAIIALLVAYVPGEARAVTAERWPATTVSTEYRIAAPADYRPGRVAGGAALADVDFGKLPLSFVPNLGQSDPSVRFEARWAGGTLLFGPGELAVVLGGEGGRLGNWLWGQRVRAPSERSDYIETGYIETGEAGVVRVRMVAANAVEPVGEGTLPGVASYFLGSDPARWRLNLPTYSGIVYGQVWPGIDLHYDGAGGRLKGTYVVAPGANIADIRWRYEGAMDIRLDEGGNLLIGLADDKASGVRRTLVEAAPVAWQDSEGERVSVAVSYVIAADGTIGFAVGRYDAARPLTIDPTLVYSTYLGGTVYDGGSGIAVDADGNAYIVGSSNSRDLGTTSPVQPSFAGGDSDVLVAKLNATGTALMYSAYLGGAASDAGKAIAVDSAGSVYIAGRTLSTNFPTANPLQRELGGPLGDAFVAKLNPAGNELVYSTYLGGRDGDAVAGIAVDRLGNAYIAGMTASQDFPAVGPLQKSYGGGDADAFVAKLSATGRTLLYSTSLGGGGTDGATGIAVDGAGNAYVVGYTTSTDFPTVEALQDKSGGFDDAFVAKLNPTGRDLVYSTYLGGRAGDRGVGIAVDGAGNAYVTGMTGSTNFPTAKALQPSFRGGFEDAFVAKLSATGKNLVYSTYLGDSRDDGGKGIAVDVLGDAYVVGYTSSSNFPTRGVVQAVNAGLDDVFVAKLNPNGSGLVFSTYLGGSDMDHGDAIALDSAGNAYITGFTFSNNFPTTYVSQDSFGGAYDAFIAKVSPAFEARYVDAKIETVWPHDWRGRQVPVGEAPLINVAVYVFERNTLDPVPCYFSNAVELQWALNLVGRDGSAAAESPAYSGAGAQVRRAIGVREIREVDGKRFPVWVFSDVPVSFVQTGDVYDRARSKMFLTARVDGADFRTNVWAHGADARTLLPEPKTPRAVGDTGSVAEAYINAVFPHDRDGVQRPVTAAPLANIGIDLFRRAEEAVSVPSEFDGAVRLLRALNNGFLETIEPQSQKQTVVGANGVVFPRWIASDVDVAAAQNAANRYFFAAKVDGLETHSTVWAHGTDTRTIFPTTDVPASSGDGCW